MIETRLLHDFLAVVREQNMTLTEDGSYLRPRAGNHIAGHSDAFYSQPMAHIDGP